MPALSRTGNPSAGQELVVFGKIKPHKCTAPGKASCRNGNVLFEELYNTTLSLQPRILSIIRKSITPSSLDCKYWRWLNSLGCFSLINFSLYSGSSREGVIKFVSCGSCTFQYCSPAVEPGEWKTNLNGDKSPGRSHPSILLTAVMGRDGIWLLWEGNFSIFLGVEL